jgi:hypothetical protein
VSKRFGAVPTLQAVDFDVVEGKVKRSTRRHA